MLNIDREYVIASFIGYVEKFGLDDKKIILKKEHTFRVADNCDYIARQSGFDKDDVNLAWIIGMLHDIGRFEQVKRFGTFVDAKSIDHARFGCDLLFEDGLIELFLPGVNKDDLRKFNNNGSDHNDTNENNCSNNLNNSCNGINNDLYVIYKSIYNHSDYRIEEGLDERTLRFSKLIRDADKIDIFKVIYETPLEDIYDFPADTVKKSSLTEEVKKQFLERHAILRKVKKTPADNYLSFIALYFELEYDCSFELTKEQGYLDKMLKFKWDNEETNEFFKSACEMINEHKSA